MLATPRRPANVLISGKLGHLAIWSGQLKTCECFDASCRNTSQSDWDTGHPEDLRGGFGAFFQCGLGSSSDRWIQVIRECQTRWIGQRRKHDRGEAGQDISRMLNFSLLLNTTYNLVLLLGWHFKRKYVESKQFCIFRSPGGEGTYSQWLHLYDRRGRRSNVGVMMASGGIWLERLVREQGRGGAGGGGWGADRISYMSLFSHNHFMLHVIQG